MPHNNEELTSPSRTIITDTDERIVRTRNGTENIAKSSFGEDLHSCMIQKFDEVFRRIDTIDQQIASIKVKINLGTM